MCVNKRRRAIGEKCPPHFPAAILNRCVRGVGCLMPSAFFTPRPYIKQIGLLLLLPLLLLLMPAGGGRRRRPFPASLLHK